jgi:hypothetical protein
VNLSFIRREKLIRLSIAALLALALAGAAAGARGKSAGDKGDKKDKPANSSGKAIDSGTFGVFIKGQRVVSETFSVQQENGNSIIKAHLKETAAPDQTEQKSDLEITGSGELLHYEWTGSAGSTLLVIPQNDFLTEKITPSTGAKPAEQAFLMPSTSVILDNNFFVQREVLAWRYLAANCHPEGGNLQCKKESADFGVLVPQDRTSMRVHMELVGKEKIPLHGADRELIRLRLSGEDFEWALWVDERDQFKLMRISIPADDTDVVRD